MTNAVGLIYVQTSLNCIYIYNQIAVYNMKVMANLHIDLE